jgi:DNA polymerase III psi subunit
MRQRIVGDKKGVILFGDNAKQYGTSVVLSMNGLQVIAAPALGVMFTSVTAKAALWRDLQALPIGKG